MRRVLTASLRGHARRLVAGGIAIVLSVAYLSAVIITTGSMNAALGKAVAAPYTHADLVVTTSSGELSAGVVRALRQVDGVAAVGLSTSTGVEATYPGGTPGYAVISAVPADQELRWHDLVSGRLPDSPREVAVSAQAAEDNQIRIGDPVELQPYGGSRRSFRVVGIAVTASMVDSASVFVSENAISALADGSLTGELLIRLDEGVEVATVSDAVAAAAGAGSSVQTGAAMTEGTLESYTGGIGVLGLFLLGFAAIAMFVALLVVTNTFSIVIAQRARELALFRCVGATKAQLFKAVLVEAVLGGAVFSIVGVAAGVGLAVATLEVIRSRLDAQIPDLELVLNPVALALPFLVGVLTTVAAAITPAHRATWVPPLAALRPAYAIRVRSKAGAIRLAIGGVLVAVGVALLVYAMPGAIDSSVVLVGIAGGALSFLGLLLLAPVVVPQVVRLLSVCVRPAGVPATVAVANAMRNPRRTAATASALLVGVTLISLLVVGAASSERTFNETLDAQYPVDLTIRSGELSAETVAAVRNVDGISGVALMRETSMKLKGWLETPVTGVDRTAATRVVRDERVLQGVRSGAVVLAPGLARRLKVQTGDDIFIGDGDRERQLRVVVGEPQAVPPVMVTMDDLAELAPNAPVVELWGRVSEDAQAGAVLESVESVVGTASNAELGGALTQRQLYSTIAEAMVLVSSGLLAVAVLIAVVGVGNTLSLSVLERTRENALLRALGLTRGGLRGTLAIEALLLSGAAVVLGIVLGIAYGYAGTSTLLGGVPEVEDIELVVPWQRIGLVAAVAMAAGLLASVLPARRAVRTPPAAALGDE